MSTAISSLSSSSWVSSLFSKIDTKNQGYIDKAELKTALEQITSDDGDTDVDKVFSALDSDNDGKITAQEMSDSMQKLADELDNQFNQSRLNGTSGKEEAYTQEELSSMIEEIGDTDSKRTALMQSIVDNFEDADTDGDGKVSNSEAMAYDQSVNGTGSTEKSAGMPPPPPPSESTSSDSSTSYEAADTNQDGTVSMEELIAYQSKNETTSTSDEKNVMKIMMQLMETYSISSDDSSQTAASSAISAIA